MVQEHATSSVPVDQEGRLTQVLLGTWNSQRAARAPWRAPHFVVHPPPLAFLSGLPFASVPPSFPLPPFPLWLCPSQPPFAPRALSV